MSIGYLILTNLKGTGKTTMLYDAMAKINADGVSLVEAHPDMEVFRLRLGKALNYEFYEDSQTGLFQRRDPREGLLIMYLCILVSLTLSSNRRRIIGH